MKDEQLILTFVRGRDSKTVARTPEGKICLLDISYCKANHIWVNEGEDWCCAVKEERTNAVIVQPITRILTKEENESLFEIKAQDLKDKFNTQH